MTIIISQRSLWDRRGTIVPSKVCWLFGSRDMNVWTIFILKLCAVFERKDSTLISQKRLNFQYTSGKHTEIRYKFFTFTGHRQFSMYAKYSKKLIFLKPLCVRFKWMIPGDHCYGIRFQQKLRGNQRYLFLS